MAGAHRRRFTLEDVVAVINAPAFDRDGAPYFSGIWGQAAQNTPAGQTDILVLLAHYPEGLHLEELADALQQEAAQVQAALQTLGEHDIVTRRGERSCYTVELMRQWVARRNARGEGETP